MDGQSPSDDPGNMSEPAGPAPRRPSRARWAKLLATPRRLPIAYKLALAITLLIVAGMSMLGLFVINNQAALMRDQANAYGQTVVSQLAEAGKELILAEDVLSLQVTAGGLTRNPDLLGAAVYAEDGKPLASTGVFPRRPVAELYEYAQPLQEDGYSLDWHWVDAKGRPQEVVSFITPVRFKDVVVGHALVTFSRNSMVESERTATRAIILATVLLSLLVVALAFVMSKQISRPIYELMDASRAIGEGNYAYRIPTRRRDEIGTLIEAFNDMAQGLLQKSQVEGALSRYVAPTVADEILANLDQIKLGGKHVDATVLFADIVGFTRLSEKMPPSEVGQFLNTYFSYITKLADMYRGTVDKFIGDCAMVVFGVPQADPDHRFNAIACAVAIQRLTERLNHDRRRRGEPPVHFRIGINTGEMLAGNMGAHERMQYTVVGDAVNLASRLSSAAAAGEIVVRDEHYLAPDVQYRVIARKYRSLYVRGKTDPIAVYRVRDVASGYREAMEQRIDILLGRGRA